MAHASDDNRVLLEPYRVVPGGAPALRERDAGDTGPFDSDHDGKKLGKRRRKALRKRLAKLQRLLYADGRYSVLVVLQAMDTGGKDSDRTPGVEPVRLWEFQRLEARVSGPELGWACGS